MSEKQLDRVSKKVKALRDEISKVQAEFPGVGNQLLGDLMRAIDMFEGKKNLFPQYFSDAKIRPSREETRIRNATEYLKRQKDMLSDIKKRKQFYLNNPGVSETISVEAVDQAIERVRLAEMQLARARGEYQSYAAAQKVKIAEEIASEKADYERSVADWQAGWKTQEWQNPGWMPKKS